MTYLLSQRLGYLEPGLNDVHVFLGRRDPALALLLKAVQHEYRFFELDGLDGAIGSIRIVFDHLQHAGTAQALHHFGCVMLLDVLGKVQKRFFHLLSK
jgi:hypothetical protein